MAQETDDAPEDYFRSRGYDVRIEKRDVHAELMAAGQHGRASFFVPSRMYFCVNLVRDGRIVAHDYAFGETVVGAMAEARRRYGSEQV